MPKGVDYYNSQGIIEANSGNLLKAVKYFKIAISKNRSFALAYYNLGLAYKHLGLLSLSVEAYRQAIKHNPLYTMNYVNLGTVYFDIGDFKKGADQQRLALAQDPQNSKAYNNLGNCLIMMGQYKQAFDAFKQALTIDPKNEVALNNMGTALREGGYLKEAFDCFKTAAKLDPNYTQAIANLVGSANNLCEWKTAQEFGKILDHLDQENIKIGKKPGEHAFTNLTRIDDPAKNLANAKAHSLYEEQLIKPLKKDLNFTFLIKPQAKKIRVGYLSDGFKNFPTGHNMVGIFEHHNRQKFEPFTFSYGDDDGSLWRKRIENATNFVDIKNLNFTEAAQKIYSKRIDILVDLKGPTGTGRTEIMILRPAPIQANFLGFAGSTGSPSIDYFIGDKITIPKTNRKYFSEKIVFMPDSYWPTDNKTLVSNKKFKRSDFGLPQDCFVFSSFNQPYKIESEVFVAWLKILAGVKNSVLWLLTKENLAFTNLQIQAKKFGVDPKRIVQASSLPKSEHLARLKLCDLVLDTRCVNGHTTTTDALWVGVPVLAISGNHFMARVSTSLLRAINLPELITTNLDDYVQLAISLGSEPEKLNRLRDKLRANLTTTALFDTPKFTFNLEKAYEEMVKIYHAGDKPKDIYL